MPAQVKLLGPDLNPPLMLEVDPNDSISNLKEAALAKRGAATPSGVAAPRVAYAVALVGWAVLCAPVCRALWTSPRVPPLVEPPPFEAGAGRQQLHTAKIRGHGPEGQAESLG